MKKYLLASSILCGVLSAAVVAALSPAWTLAGFFAGVVLAFIAGFASDFSYKEPQSSFKYGKKYEASFDRRMSL